MIDVLSLTGGNIGTIREVFVVNQLSYQHKVEYTKAGDLLVDKKYTIEIGGKSKDGKQIANIHDSYIESKTPMDCMMFLVDLKKKINGEV